MTTKRTGLRAAAAALAIAALAAGPSVAQDAPRMQDVSGTARASFQIDIDSIRRSDDLVQFRLLSRDAAMHTSYDGQVQIDCAKKQRRELHAFIRTDGRPTVANGPGPTMTDVLPGTRQALEMSYVCAKRASAPSTATPPFAMAPANAGKGISRRGAVGFFVSADGVLVAPHLLVYDCKGGIEALMNGRGVDATVLAQDGDIVLLKVPGGPYTPMPASRAAADGQTPVTVLGVSASQWRVAAGNVLPARSNARDEGWPQLQTMPGTRVAAGAAWAPDGGVVGLGIDVGLNPPSSGLMRLVPTWVVQRVLSEHGAHWDAQPPVSDALAAMRRAVAATVPLQCR